MTSTTHAMDRFTQLAAVRVVASTNQSGTYFNGAINNGVGATLIYATGVLTIDSVVVLLKDYVLLAGQTNGFENGIYECTQAGAVGVPAVLTRRGDFQCIEQISGGSFVPVSAGTAFGGSFWQVVEPYPAAIGTPATAGLNNINFATVTAAGSSLYLQRSNNLSDVTSAATARTNLGAQASANIKAAQSSDIGGGGAGPIDVAVVGLTSASVVSASILSSSNTVAIAKVLPGTDKFSVTFSADPGASCVLNYVAFVAAQ